MYYSGWLEPFQSDFATQAARHGAIPLVQINPTDINMAAIVSGTYDSYLDAFANAVRSYDRPVIIGFGHEMNGNWYSWSYRHTSPMMFVHAWRHIVDLFKTVGAENVTWHWTINVIAKQAGIANPMPWWPGDSYVNWVGIDGYYGKSSIAFVSLFGPTIVAVRSLTNAPILIAETGIAQTGSQSTQIADLFTGIHTYGLLGLIWFDAVGKEDWRIITPSAVSALRQGAEVYHRV
jgi:beta-mannanase